MLVTAPTEKKPQRRRGVRFKFAKTWHSKMIACLQHISWWYHIYINKKWKTKFWTAAVCLTRLLDGGKSDEYTGSLFCDTKSTENHSIVLFFVKLIQPVNLSCARYGSITWGSRTLLRISILLDIRFHILTLSDLFRWKTRIVLTRCKTMKYWQSAPLKDCILIEIQSLFQLMQNPNFGLLNEPSTFYATIAVWFV